MKLKIPIQSRKQVSKKKQEKLGGEGGEEIKATTPSILIFHLHERQYYSFVIIFFFINF